MCIGIHRLYYKRVRLPILQNNAYRASDKCKQEKRKTINGDDLLYAMTALGFDKYTEPLRVYLGKYREVRSPSSF